MAHLDGLDKRLRHREVKRSGSTCWKLGALLRLGCLQDSVDWTYYVYRVGTNEDRVHQSIPQGSIVSGIHVYTRRTAKPFYPSTPPSIPQREKYPRQPTLWVSRKALAMQTIMSYTSHPRHSETLDPHPVAHPHDP